MSTKLTQYESRIVNILAQTPNRVVSRSLILQAMYPNGAEAKANVVEVLVGRIRRKGYKVKAVRGMGYQLVEEM